MKSEMMINDGDDDDVGDERDDNDVGEVNDVDEIDDDGDNDDDDDDKDAAYEISWLLGRMWLHTRLLHQKYSPLLKARAFVEMIAQTWLSKYKRDDIVAW